MDKCPQCGNNTVEKLPVPKGEDGFFLGSYKLEKNSPVFSVNPANGMPLEAFGCSKCNAVMFKGLPNQ